MPRCAGCRRWLLGPWGGYSCPGFRLVPKTRHAKKHFKLFFGFLGISDDLADLRTTVAQSYTDRLPGFPPGFRLIEFCPVPSFSKSDSTAGGIRQAALPYFTAMQVVLCTFQCWAWQAFPQYLAALHRLHELRLTPLPDAPQ